MPPPNFLIIGAAKSGTTALYAYLKQHPQIFMSAVKEPRFFALEGERVAFKGPGDAGSVNKESVNNWNDYLRLFSAATNERAIGEASPLYLYSTRAPERIHYYLPRVKLIAILRNPVERAFSAYMMHVMDGREKMSFEQAVRDEPRRIRENWIWGHYVNVGLYSRQIARYFEHFSKEQLRVYLYEDLTSDPNKLLRELFHFLEVDHTFEPDISTKHNISGRPANQFLHRALSKRYGTSGRLRSAIKKGIPIGIQRTLKDMRSRNLIPQSLSPETRQSMLPLFRDDVLRLEEILNRDLHNWLT